MASGEDNEVVGIEESADSELYENKIHVINELLFYVSNYTKGGSCTPDNIKNIILSFYDEDKIWKAKVLLWKKVKTGVLKKLEKRKDTVQRSAKDANAFDIVQAFQDMDKKSYYEIICLAANINDIPREHPEKLHELSMLDRISVLESKFKIVEPSMSRNYVEIIEIVDEIKKMNGNIATQETLIQNVAQQVQQEFSKTRKGSISKSVKDDTLLINQIHKVHIAKVPKVRSRSLPETEKSKNNEFTQEKANLKKVRKDTVNERDRMSNYRPSNNRDTNANQFYRKREGTNQGKPKLRTQALTLGRDQLNAFNERKRHESQRNAYQDNNHKDEVFFNSRVAGDNRRDSSGFEFTRDQRKRMQYKNRLNEANYIRLFVFNVPNHYYVDNVYDHFTNLGVDVKDVWQRSHPDSRKKSFVVKMPKDEMNYVLEDDIMESLNIRIRDYSDRSD